MNAMSTLDTIAHEIFVLYDITPLPPRIYINTARDMLVSIHHTSALTALLNNQLNSPWFIDFQSFRHCTTHESIIRHDDILPRFDPVARRYRLSRRIKLPDNPQVRPFTYNRNRIANEYVTSTFRKVNRLVVEVYRNALRDIRTFGNILPVPSH